MGIFLQYRFTKPQESTTLKFFYPKVCEGADGGDVDARAVAAGVAGESQSAGGKEAEEAGDPGAPAGAKGQNCFERVVEGKEPHQSRQHRNKRAWNRTANGY